MSSNAYAGTFEEIHDQPKEKKGNGHAQHPRFRLKPFEAIKLSTAPNYLVKGILPRAGLAVVWGPPKCGKSFWTFDLTMHVALGWKYRGRRVQQGPVVYCALEGGVGFADRVEAWRQRLLAQEHTPVPFYLLDVPLDLVTDRLALAAAIRDQLASPPAVIVIDTLNRALVGDENKSDDMAKLIRAADLLRETFGSLVILVHHCGVVRNRPRGHTSLAGANDAQIAVIRDQAGNITVTVEHMKDGEPGAPLGCKLERVELGADDDGDPKTTCLIVPAELAKKERPLPDTAKLALEQLQELIADTGEVPPTSNRIPPNVRVCSAIAWRESFYNVYAGKPDTKQKAFVRATLKLQEARLIGIWSDKAWLAGHAGHGQTF
jgi:hypothetical protein